MSGVVFNLSRLSLLINIMCTTWIETMVCLSLPNACREMVGCTFS